jgi:hypothetical protein
LQNTFLGPIFQGDNQSQSLTIAISANNFINKGLADFAYAVITEEKIRWAVKGFGSYETAGEDGIFPGLLQQRIETLVVPLCKVLTACLVLEKTESYIHTKARA